MRSRLLTAAALLGALALAACDASTTGPMVGRTCADFTECGGRSTSACIAAWPEGYCTEVACLPGSCAAGARCAQGVMFTGVPVEAFCLATCTAKPDCREGYDCVDIGQAEDVCVPENPR